MAKKKTSKKQERSLNKLSRVDLSKVKGLTRLHPTKELLNRERTALAISECILNNDPDGVVEMIRIYLEAVNKANLQREENLPKSTMYSALKHKNPTIRTLAKIMQVPKE